MNLFDRARAALTAMFAPGASAPVDVPAFHNPNMWRWSGGGPTNSGVRVTDDMAQTLSGVWACCSLRADLVAQCPVGLFKKEGDSFTRIEPQDHPVAGLLDRGFNADMSTQMGVYVGESQLGIGGNSYYAIERERDGTPVSLHNLDPYATEPWLHENVPYDLISHYRTTYQGRQYRYEPFEVAHLRGHTSRGVIGLSPIAAAREALGLGLALEKYGAKFFANDSRSGGYIIQPADTNARGKRAQQGNISGGDMGGQGGPDMAHAPKILDPGSKYIPVTITQADSQFLESRAFQLAEIARFYRVPLVFLDSAAATAWGSGIEQLKLGFVEFTINPLADRWQDELGRKLLTVEERAEGYFIDLDSSVLLQGDMAARGEFYSKAITAGWLLRNEARKRERLNPVEGLDKPVLGVNMQDGSDAPKPPDPNKQPPQGSAPNAPPAKSK